MDKNNESSSSSPDSTDGPPLSTLGPFTSSKVRLTWLGSVAAVGIAFVWATFLILKFSWFLKMDAFFKATQKLSPLQFACLVGVEVGLLTIVSLFLFLIPTMILTWTTALIFDYACSRGLARRELVIQDGNKLAREIFLGTLKSVIREGNFIAMLVMVFCLLGAFFSSHVLELQGSIFNL